MQKQNEQFWNFSKSISFEKRWKKQEQNATKIIHFKDIVYVFKWKKRRRKKWIRKNSSFAPIERWFEREKKTNKIITIKNKIFNEYKQNIMNFNFSYVFFVFTSRPLSFCFVLSFVLESFDVTSIYRFQAE